MDMIRKIVSLMEDMPMPGTTSVLSGGSSAQMAMGVMPGDSPHTGMQVDEYDEGDISPETLDLARELVLQAGSAEKAREIVDKVEEVMELLGSVVKGGDTDMISKFADSMPDEPDMPNDRHNEFGMSSAYNPSNIR